MYGLTEEEIAMVEGKRFGSLIKQITQISQIERQG
jgi:hypothetical protein